MVYKLIQWIFQHPDKAVDSGRITWTSISGKLYKLTELDDGHLCNIIHYNKFISGIPTHPDILDEIRRRFGSETRIKAYYPKIEFEVKKLKELGLLKLNDKKGYDIVSEGKVIGAVSSETINSFIELINMYKQDKILTESTSKKSFNEQIIL